MSANVGGAIVGAASAAIPTATEALTIAAKAAPTITVPTSVASITHLHARARLYAHVRAFFAERAVLEVETPILSAAGNTDPNIASFHTEFSGHVDAGSRRRWLRTSPEFPLKRLLAAGAGDCYELGRVFRNGEAGARHNPEFTMLEWYRVGWDHRRLMTEVSALIVSALALFERKTEIVEISYRDWFFQALEIDPHVATVEALQNALSDVRIDAQDLGRDDWLDLLITHRLQAANPEERLLLVYDYPATQCALARIRRGEPTVAERFEAYLGARELANGYHELNDADEQRGRFERDLALRAERRLPLPAVDQRLLAALPNLPDCAGVAMGMDRLLMCLLGVADIRDLLAFDFAGA
jgi:elongation factor P--(R)-beta-lysine ligase